MFSYVFEVAESELYSLRSNLPINNHLILSLT